MSGRVDEGVGGGARGGPTRRVHPPAAFTLIELLVVIAIIGILASLLMPAVLRAMRSATTTQCKSNAKQMAAALVLYTTRYGGFMPPTGHPPRNPYWYKNLSPFVDDSDVFRCPAKKRAKIGYGLNHIWCGPNQIYGSGTAMWTVPKEIERVRNPAGTLIITDAGRMSNKDDPPEEWVESDATNTDGSCFFPYDNRPGQPGKYTCWYDYATAASPRHVGFHTIVLFFDSHVAGIATRDIIDDLWDEPGCIYDNDGHPKRKF